MKKNLYKRCINNFKKGIFKNSRILNEKFDIKKKKINFLFFIIKFNFFFFLELFIKFKIVN